MAQLTLTEVQRTLLGIITSVEAGVTTPEEAVLELTRLKAQAQVAGLKFSADYMLADFQKIRNAVASEFDSSTPIIETPYESSFSSSY